MKFAVITFLSCLAFWSHLSWAETSPAQKNTQFLSWFWERPLATQGEVRTLPHQEQVCHPLVPGTCGLCHTPQYTDWQRSRHAKAMGPGTIGQFFHMHEAKRQDCMNCHAPLYEQGEALEQHLYGYREAQDQCDSSTANSETHVDKPLPEQGVICAACHIRAGRWYGPPRRKDILPLETSEPLPHDGWTSDEAFQDSRFCSACHQFPPDGFRLNGKLIENTYEEWLASPQAQEGESCQSCHMPNRRHLFRGIHDPETVQSGVEVGSHSFSLSQGEVTVSVFLTNTGVGHRLPTYVTPEIHLEAYQEDDKGMRIPDTEQITWVARRVSLDLTTEHFDTRLSPGQTATLSYKKAISPRARSLVTRVYVEPDAFYRRIYEALLEMRPQEPGSDLIHTALADSKRSGFSIYEQRYLLVKQTGSDK